MELKTSEIVGEFRENDRNFRMFEWKSIFDGCLPGRMEGWADGRMDDRWFKKESLMDASADVSATNTPGLHI